MGVSKCCHPFNFRPGVESAIVVRFEDVHEVVCPLFSHDDEIREERFFAAFLIRDTKGPITPLEVPKPTNEIVLLLRPPEECSFPTIEIRSEFAVCVGE